MTLPILPGWLIDFRTAREIFSSGSNERISHCVGLCGSGQLQICHCEEQEFKGVSQLKSAFIDEQNCIVVPDDDILERCLGISAGRLGSNILTGNNAAVFITAIAASRGYGVISNHRSISFSTAYDLCKLYGIPVYSADKYFELLAESVG